MRAVHIREFGAVEQLRIEEIADPQAGPGQVVVDIHATAANFVCACDMPLIHPKLLSALHRDLPGYEALVPIRGLSPQPPCAFYRRTCLEGARRLLLEGKGPLDLLKTLNTRWVEAEKLSKADPEGLSFLDVDTRSDLLRAEKAVDKSRRTPC